MTYIKLRNNKVNLWIIIHLRYLLGLAFFPSGITKLIGHRFTNIGVESPIGFFFEALYRSGFYWNFLGLAQLTAGILLMTQRFALLGTLIFFAILTNVWLITLSLSFHGTWIITSLMMIATVILLIWDYQKLLPLVSIRKSQILPDFPEVDRMWIFVGIIYSLSFIFLSLDDPFAEKGSKILARILIAIIFITFFMSNFLWYKKHIKEIGSSI